MPAIDPAPILLTGATGFVGRRFHPTLVAAGYEVRCTTRDPDRARRSAPEKAWVHLDLETPETLAPALAGCRAAFYLMHAMAADGDYERRERRGAEVFAAAAAAAGLERIVYLGGISPHNTASKHLRSRLVTGQLLRAGAVPCFEVQAAMIIGAGSTGWQIVRDLAARLPVMVIPRWMKNRSQPLAIADLLIALLGMLELPRELAGARALPGPEILSASEILRRTAALLGHRPIMLPVPVVTPRLSSYWINLVTRANHRVARELVEGLRSDLVVEGEGWWRELPAHERLSFDAAAQLALAEEADVRSRRPTGRDQLRSPEFGQARGRDER